LNSQIDAQEMIMAGSYVSSWIKRGALLVGAATLGAAVLLAGTGVVLQTSLISRAVAQTVMGPPGFADIVDKVKPAVISVRVKFGASPRTTDDGSSSPQESPLDRFFRQFGAPEGSSPNGSNAPPRNVVTGQGSGFFISADGYAVTNYHVVENTETVQVITDDGKTYPAKVVGVDARTDIAVIKVDGRNDFRFVKFAEGSPRIGDWVLAVGNPFGLGGSVTAGIVSARGRDIGEGPYDDFIQIDAPVNRGNSGGPTFNMEGNVIGVNTAIYSPSGGSVGIAFAVPADTVKAVVAQLKDKGSVTRGYIGVQIQEITPDIAETLVLKTARGALVAEPEADGPAAKAGVEAGDVITAINGVEVADTRDVARTISGMAPGTSVKLTVMRSGQERTLNVTLGKLPDERQANATPSSPLPRDTNMARLGLTVAAQAGGNGVIVTNVDPAGIAAEQGFKTGDVILEVAGKKVANPADLSNAIQAAQKAGKGSVLLRLKSGSGTKYVTLPVARG
jgi:serine protease Do